MFNIGRKTIYTLILAFIQIAGIALFCKGFFPYKIYLSGYATRGDQFSLHEQPQEPEFDRLVFVLIDALRNDFLIGKDSGFDFVNSHIKQGSAYPFTAKATAPTVTLPRIKALTTGTIPSFLDAILNIAESDTSSSLENHDNWVYQFKNQNKTIHFFGDDTWMRLFPNIFDKTDGTTSFFVSDTIEVDLNVTRHIQTDLVKQDWDAVILHYLGLDHIGHLGGPESPLMKPKQKEMDQAIESIYNIIAAQDAKRIQEQNNAKGTLIVVCGDHGMNEKGNHGGSSIGETSAGLVFMSPRFESRPSKKQRQFGPFTPQESVLGFPVIDQIDIVPTLAALFSFPIPKNNLGKVILELYPFKQDSTGILNGILLNASQLGQLLSKLIPEISGYLETPYAHVNDASLSFGQSYAKAVSLHRKYLITKDESLAKQAIQLYSQFIEFAQLHLSNTASDYNIQFMIIGVALIGFSTIGFICLSLQQPRQQQQQQQQTMWRFSQYFSVFALIIYSSSMFSSSFVEEEHYTWYYLLQTITLLSVISSFRIPVAPRKMLYPIGLCFGQLFLVRTAIAWNHNNISNLILSCSGVQWHLMGFTLFTTVIFGIKALYKLSSQSNMIDANSTAKIIQNLVKSIMLIIIILNSILVFIYKIRSSSTTIADNEVPRMYASLLNWELVQPLDQVTLGKLIYNYGGAGLFVLGGLFYVTKKAHLMDIVQEIEEDNDDEEEKEQEDGDDDEEGQAQALLQAQLHAQAQGAIQVDEKRTLILQMLLYLVTPLLILLSRPQNAILFLFFHMQFKLLVRFQLYLLDSKISLPTWLIGVLVTCLGHASFFLTGHDNSIASVDLSNAYVGVQEYDTILIGILTFCSNWSGSIWWSVAGWTCISREKNWFSYIMTQTILFSIVMTTLSISVTVLREHLFIWTVFSPKYLYQIAWNCLFHWIVQVFIGSIITQIFFK